jgi:drug/metabolite transporter (DMT)-like permease
MDLRVIGLSAALGSAASWAIGSILFKRLGEKISPVAMTLAKGIISVILLALALVLVGYGDIDIQALLLLILSGLLGIALGDTFFFEALQDLGAHTLVLFGLLGQVLTVILAVLFLNEQPSQIAWIGIILVIWGIGIVLYGKLSNTEQSSGIRGISFGLLSVICMSASIIIAKEGLESVSAIQATFIRMLAGTTGMLFFGLSTRRLGRWMIPFKDIQLVIFFFISVSVVTFGGFWLSLVAIKYVDVSIANTLNETEPLFVLPLAAIFLKEKITLQAIIGTVMATVGVILLCIS